jgi:serine phosphatase RsbU (regulator of sigma subunit)
LENSEALVAQQQVVRLQALLEASRQLHSTIELDEVLGIALQIVVRELELTGAFFTTFPHTYGTVSPELRDFPDGSTALPVEVPSQQLLRFSLTDKAGHTFTELVVLLPLDRTLDLDETDFLESLSIQAAVAIENARFHHRALQWQRVESDLAAARQVQLSLVPQQMPTIPNYQLAARSVTCYEVGGDYLDIVTMPSGDTIIVVGDVAGKGLASALVGSSFRSALRAMTLANLSLYEIATQMNVLHHGEGEEARRRYVTAILLRLNPAANTLEVLNAGHNPAFLLSASGALTKITASGTPIGILPFSTYVPEMFDFSPGTRLLVYTDGMTEVFCGEEEFGEDRLLETFIHCEETTANKVLESLWHTLEVFSDGQEQSDDMTALVLLRNP